MESVSGPKMKITDIRCPGCGSAAAFDIAQQRYVCAYCGGKVEINAAKSQTYGFRQMQSRRLQNTVSLFQLSSVSCSGCGATVVFEENEALSNCAFCGRSLVRKDYLSTEDLPENVIPFALTEEEGKARLKAWCLKNRGKREAKQLLARVDQLKGYYLPYELVRGPVHLTVARMAGSAHFPCEGFLKDTFINRSRQLDNLLLDGMEPFDLDALTEFDFAYVAGHRVKISDISNDVLEERTAEEVSETYKPSVRKVLESNAVYVRADVGSALRIPVLLPVYYIADGEIMAAVNGQTGKVSVRAEKPSHYIFLPWWFKAVLATGIICGALFAGLYLFGMSRSESLFLAGMLGLVMIIIALCVYSDTTRNRFRVEAGRKIFTSGGGSFRRENGKLVPSGRLLEKKVEGPLFFREIKGKKQQVVLKFTTPRRVTRMVLLSLTALFLPVMIALLLNGFDFAGLELGGSAAWFCLMVPLVPVFILKFGIVELYDHPWVYTVSEKGKLQRVRKERSSKISKSDVKMILQVVFVPPASLAVWFGIICFFTMCYLTAFGFGD